MTFAWLAAHWWVAAFLCYVAPSATIAAVLLTAAIAGAACRRIAARFTRWNTAPDVLAAVLKRPDEPFDSMISVVCPCCVPWGRGPGTCCCPRECEHGDCQGGNHTTLSPFTAEDAAWLRSLPTGPVPRPRVVWYRRRATPLTRKGTR